MEDKYFRGFWPYFGRKHKLVKAGYYPDPLPTGYVIETHAGAASYATRYYDREVVLVDLDDWVIETWQYLKNATPSDILRLPIIPPHGDARDYGLSRVELHFVGYNLSRGCSRPQYKPGAYNSWTSAARLEITQNLYRIKHWKIIHGDYRTAGLPNQNSTTWFIDPPYRKNGGHRYRHNNQDFDYKALSDFIYSRRGLVVACELVGCGWLPTKHLTTHRGVSFTRTEGVYIQEPKVLREISV